jgi:hypothetical protein
LCCDGMKSRVFNHYAKLVAIKQGRSMHFELLLCFMKCAIYSL